MNLTDAIEQLINQIEDSCYTYNKSTNTIEKKTIFVSSFVEQSQMIRIVQILDQLGIFYEIQINGSIKLFRES